jgi:UDP-glucose 4-epimerase
VKALVVGGNGFIGSHLVDRLLFSGWAVTVLDVQERRYEPMPERVRFIKGDLAQPFLVRESLIDVDIVFHLAWSTIHESSNHDLVADVQANLIPSIRLFEACRQADVKRVVFVSSGGAVYGRPYELPILESHPKNPISGYGITKLAVEKYLQMFEYLHGLDYVVLRPSVPYGPCQNPMGKQGVVSIFLYRVAQGLPVTIWGDGSIIRDYFYISDLVEALVSSTEQELLAHRVFNIGGAKAVSLMELLGHIENTVKKNAIVEYRPVREFDAQAIVLDTRLANVELGWQPRVSIVDGLAETWEWMGKNESL